MKMTGNFALHESLCCNVCNVYTNASVSLVLMREWCVALSWCNFRVHICAIIPHTFLYYTPVLI